VTRSRSLIEARKTADASRERLKDELEEDRQRRLEETKRQIEAETHRALGPDPAGGRRADAASPRRR